MNAKVYAEEKNLHTYYRITDFNVTKPLRFQAYAYKLDAYESTVFKLAPFLSVCFMVCVQYDTKNWKSGEKWGRPGNTYYVMWT